MYNKLVNHSINRQVVEVNVSGKINYRQLQIQITDILKGITYPEISKICDKYDNSKLDYYIKSIDIDLGKVKASMLKEALSSKVLIQFEQNLCREIQKLKDKNHPCEQKHGGNITSQVNAESDSYFNIVSLDKGKRSDLTQVVDDMVLEISSVMQQYLRKECNKLTIGSKKPLTKQTIVNLELETKNLLTKSIINKKSRLNLTYEEIKYIEKSALKRVLSNLKLNRKISLYDKRTKLSGSNILDKNLSLQQDLENIRQFFDHGILPWNNIFNKTNIPNKILEIAKTDVHLIKSLLSSMTAVAMERFVLQHRDDQILQLANILFQDAKLVSFSNLGLNKLLNQISEEQNIPYEDLRTNYWSFTFSSLKNEGDKRSFFKQEAKEHLSTFSNKKVAKEIASEIINYYLEYTQGDKDIPKNVIQWVKSQNFNNSSDNINLHDKKIINEKEYERNSFNKKDVAVPSARKDDITKNKGIILYWIYLTNLFTKLKLIDPKTKIFVDNKKAIKASLLIYLLLNSSFKNVEEYDLVLNKVQSSFKDNQILKMIGTLFQDSDLVTFFNVKLKKLLNQITKGQKTSYRDLSRSYWSFIFFSLKNEDGKRSFLKQEISKYLSIFSNKEVAKEIELEVSCYLDQIKEDKEISTELISWSKGQIYSQKVINKQGSKSSDFDKKDAVMTLVREGVLIKNTGIILYWVYLTNLFTKLKLIDPKTKMFVDNKKAIRATLLIHLLVDNTFDTVAEYDLTLNKILCGLPLDLPMPIGIDIRPEERKEFELLTETLISNWKVLGKLSIIGFCQLFIDRVGLLKWNETSWLLRVERKPQDVLIKKLSWPIRVVKLPWMVEHILVEW